MQVIEECNIQASQKTIYLTLAKLAHLEGKKEEALDYFLKAEEELQQIHILSLDNQKEDHLNHFNDWKGTNEQLDDVCILGVKVTKELLNRDVRKSFAPRTLVSQV